MIPPIMKGQALNFYKKRLGLESTTLSLIEHGEAMVATVYRVTKEGTEPRILKINRHAHHHLREVYFLRRLENRVVVPKILQVVDPAEGVDGAILMECLPGELLSDSVLTEPLAYGQARRTSPPPLYREV